MKRIFITGCARSGTTLLNRLFHSFEDTEVVSPETSIDAFCALSSDNSVFVAKRTPLTILSVPLPGIELERQLKLIHQHDIQIVNIVRDGRDVVHQNPTGPRVNVNRWIGCILQAQRFRKDIALQVRYEDLVKTPDLVQEHLVTTLNLQPTAPFSNYPSFVPDRVFEEIEYYAFPYYRKRPIDQTSIGHSPVEWKSLCTNDIERDFFERTLARLGYTSAEDWETWSPDVLLREEAIFRYLSRLLGYCYN